MNELICKEIRYKSEEYKISLDLRNKILRVPLGLKLTREDILADAKDFHLGAFQKGDLAACLILTPSNDKSSIKMRQVAVAEEMQGKQVGSRLVAYAEDFAREKGFALMWCNARDIAVPFYQKRDYKVIGDYFTEVSIPHLKMEKALK